MFSEVDDGMGILLALIYVLLLAPGIFRREGKERVLYTVLFAISLITAFVAGAMARQDHIGASLSGMVSIFMR